MSRTCLVLVLLGGSLGVAAPNTRTFTESVRPFLAKYCQGCHNASVLSGGLNLVTATNTDYQVWQKVSMKVHAGMMPPPGLPKPPATEVKAI